MPFISGAYTMSYGGNAVGQISEGITIQHTINKRLITGDNQAQTPQDAVYQGAECFMRFTLMEYDQTIARPVWQPYGGWGGQGQVGTLDTDQTQLLVLTNTVGTPAEGQPTEITAQRAILREGFPVDILLAPDLREIPVELRLYPYVISGPKTVFFETSPAWPDPP